MSFRKKIPQLCLLAVLATGTCLPLYSVEYTVKAADTLFGLALEYDIPQSLIARVNNLETTDLRIGQVLVIPTETAVTITVRPGDTLSALSLMFDVPVDDIMDANTLEDGNLRIGQELTIPAPLPGGRYRVRSGDTLISIARRHDLPVSLLKAINGLDSDTIRPGEVLETVPDRPATRLVGSGESLWTIAVENGVSMDELRSWNNLERDVIHPGDILALYPGIEALQSDFVPSSGTSGGGESRTTVALASVRNGRAEEKPTSPSLPRVGEYFYSAPRRESQPDNRYWEESDASPITDYRRGLKVMEVVDADIAGLPRLSNALAGWHIVIDPGHGGLDPGAIVTVQDGNDNPLTVTEDEYAYDISLRIYRALKRHGASVSMTILAPDHGIRDGENARQTFVHRKNEVYNDEAHNGNQGWRPVGNIEGLDLRKEIASEQISRLPAAEKRQGTLYIGVHADNSPDLPAGRVVLFDGNTESERTASRELATTMAGNLGAGAFVKEQQLRVLRNNPTDAAVIVEVRNVHYERNCWALRSAELREQDALMVVDGILNWSSGR